MKVAPTIRYTQDNQTAIAEMDVTFDGLRADDPPGLLKVVGWGNLAQDIQNRIQVGQRLILEGRLRMNTVTRTDGIKEKKAEFTLSKIHSPSSHTTKINQEAQSIQSTPIPAKNNEPEVQDKIENPVTWDSSPLIPDTDDIPF